MAPIDDLDPDGIYHLATAAEWERYRETGLIQPPSLATEGFVHCSWGHQVAGTVAKHFPDVTDLLAIHLEAGLGGGLTVVEEDSYGSGQQFPHVYAPIPVSAVIGVRATGLQHPRPTTAGDHAADRTHRPG